MSSTPAGPTLRVLKLLSANHVSVSVQNIVQTNTLAAFKY